MSWIKNIDATIIVAALGLIGTFYTIQSNKSAKKQDTMVQANEQLMNMVQSLTNEITVLKEQHEEESRRLELKIVELTGENQELRNEVTKLNNYLIKLGIPV